MKQIKKQCLFNKDFNSSSKKTELNENLLACGWWTLNREKLENSKADFWIFVLHSFTERDSQHVIIKPKKLLEIYDILERKGKLIPTYIWVTKQKLCWESRDIKKVDKLSLIKGKLNDSNRNLTEYLENWKEIEEILGVVKKKNR